MRTYTM